MATLNDLTKVIELAKEHLFECIDEQFNDNFDLQDIQPLYVDYDGERFEIGLSLVDEGSWNGDDKYHDKTNVFELLLCKEGIIYNTEKYFRQSLMRTGSYYTDWYYTNERPEEVIRKVRVVEEVYYESVEK